MKKQLKPISQFKNEGTEREFWASADTSQYFDYESAEQVMFPNLKPSATSISLRLPESLLYEIKVLANKRDVPYQSMMKMWLADRVKDEGKKYSA